MAAEGALIVGEHTDGYGGADIGLFTVTELDPEVVSPRVDAPAISTRRLLPFTFRRKTRPLVFGPPLDAVA